MILSLKIGIVYGIRWKSMKDMHGFNNETTIRIKIWISVQLSATIDPKDYMFVWNGTWYYWIKIGITQWKYYHCRLWVLTQSKCFPFWVFTHLEVTELLSSVQFNSGSVHTMQTTASTSSDSSAAVIDIISGHALTLWM